MALKLKMAKERIAVPYKDEDGNVLATFIIEKVTPTEFGAMAKKCEVVCWDSPSKKVKKERFVEVDFVKLTIERIKKIIVDWEGLEDENGLAIPCTPENKVRVYELHPEVINKVLEEHDKLVELEEEEKEEEEKN